MAKSAEQGDKNAQQILEEIETEELKGKTYKAIDKVAGYIPYFGVGWNIGKAIYEFTH